MGEWLAEVIASDNQGDPLVEWLRRYFGPCATNMLPHPKLRQQCVFAKSRYRRSEGDSEDIIWYRTWVVSPYSYCDHSSSTRCRIEHPAVVGSSLEHTRAMIPVAIYHSSYHTDPLLQTWWWYVKWREGCQATDVIKIVEFDPDQRYPIIWNVSYGTLYTWIRAVQRFRYGPSSPAVTIWPIGRCLWMPTHDQLDHLVEVIEFCPKGARLHHQDFPVWHTDMRQWPMFAMSTQSA